jgi:integrase
MSVLESGQELTMVVQGTGSSALAQEMVSELGDIAAQRGEDEKTKAAYSKYAKRYISWCLRSGLKPSRESLIEWRDILAKSMAPSTVNVHMSAVRALLEELYLQERIDDLTYKGMLAVKGVKRKGQRVGNWLGKDEFSKLIDQQPKDTNKGLRDRALLALLAYCGLRRSEAAALKLGDLKVVDGQPLAEIRGKGNKTRIVPIHPKATVILGEWVRAAGIKEGYVIRSVNKGDNIQQQGMTATAVYQNIKRMGEEAGIEVAPHDLRRTCARSMYNGGADISGIQTFLGHDDPKTTQIYLGLHVDDAAAAMKAMTL